MSLLKGEFGDMNTAISTGSTNFKRYDDIGPGR